MQQEGNTIVVHLLPASACFRNFMHKNTTPNDKDMLHIKEVITIFCKYLSITVGSTLTPECLRLAKYNKNSNNAISALWTTLDKVTYFALREINDNISLSDFDTCVRTKLRLAYLQYPYLEIYSSSDEITNSSSRTLLLALVWVIGKYDILKNIIKIKLLNSPLGKEFSKIDRNFNVDIDDAKLSTVEYQAHNLLQKTNKLSNNLKAISELYMAKIKLMTKVHTASMSVSGLPHLTVSEMSLIKKIATKKDNNELDLEKLKEMETMAIMLDTHMKWIKKSPIFFTWMSTVLDEYEKTNTSEFIPEAITELTRFIYLLRHLIRKRLKSIKPDCFLNSNLVECPSRLLRVQKCTTEIHMFLNDIRNKFNVIDDTLQKKRIDLEIELKSVLSFIPNCIHV